MGVGDLGLVADALPDGQRLLVAAAHRGDLALPPQRPAERLEQAGPQSRVVVRPRRGGHGLEPARAIPRGGRASARSATSRTRGRSRPADPGPRRPDRAPRGCRRARAPAGRATGAGRRPTAGRRASAASATYQSRWRAWIIAVSPRASRCSAAYSRIVSSIRKRGSPSTVSSTLTRLWSASAIRPSTMSPPSSRRRSADRLGGGQVAAAGEDRQAVEQALGAVVEEVVAPGDRGAQGLLPLGQVAGARREQVELVPQPGQDRVRRQELDPGRRQLDRQRHPVEPGADRGHRRRVLVGDREPGLDRHRAFDEQAHRGVLAERRRIEGARLAGHGQPLQPAEAGRVGRRREAGDRELLLARDPQRRPGW